MQIYNIGCKRFAQSAGPGILQLTFFDALEPLLRYCRSPFCDLGVIFGAFWGNLYTLGVIFGALWVYCLCPKTDWRAKGAPSGASPKIPSPFWAQFWWHFSTIFVFEGSIQRASEKISKSCIFEPSQTSKTKSPPRREHDLQVLTKFRKC